jgi:hypothetical protein
VSVRSDPRIPLYPPGSRSAPAEPADDDNFAAALADLVNHVPDEVTEAMERFGEAVLRGEAGSVGVDLRSDVRLRMDWTAADLEAGAVRMEVLVEHDHPPDSLRGFGSFVGTRLDGVEATLREWGVEPPADYDRVGTEGYRALYAGTLRL